MKDLPNDVLAEIRDIFDGESAEEFIEGVQGSIKPMTDDMVKLCYTLFELELQHRDIDTKDIF